MTDELRGRIRFDVKNTARVWDYWLGGMENYPVDRAAGDAFRRLYPDITRVAREDRRFLERVVRYLARECGVRQFLDLGMGMPTARNTHEIAQEVASDSRVVYVDNDPVVLAHARAWMANSTDQGAVTCLDADVNDPGPLIAEVGRALDLRQPVAVILLGVLGHVADSADRMHAITRQLLAPTAPGSYLVVGDGVDTGHPGFREACRRHRYHLRTLDEMRACVSGMELLEPGVVPVDEWRPTDSAAPGQERLLSYVAVARTPVGAG